jgi:cell division protein FtsZ
LINRPAIINLDFADVQTVMKNKGVAHIGIGVGKGDDKAKEAVQMAIDSPLLETTIHGATDVIINVSGDITLNDASEAASYVQELAGTDVNIIFGAMYDASKPEECTISVIATGLEELPRFNKKDNKGFRPSSLGKPMTSNLKSVAQLNATKHIEHEPLDSSHKPKAIRNNVEERTISIPSFLQKK